jgi:hypothetical protein
MTEAWLMEMGLEGYTRWMVEDKKISSQDELITLAKSGSKVRTVEYFMVWVVA